MEVFPIDVDFDDEVDDDVDAKNISAGAGSVSHEFIGYRNQGLTSFCWAPWRMLKIDIRARTSICCDFAHKLPKFTWPTARTFHDESEMWNHPYMQLMRRTMGKPDELPFCKFCREADKRDTNLADQRRDTMRASQRIYRDLVEKIETAKAKGAVERFAAKPESFGERLSIKADDAALRRIVSQRSLLRNISRVRGFADCKRILQIGCLNGSITPYLAETAEEVVVVDTRQAPLSRIRGVAEALEFDNIRTQLVKRPDALPFEDASFHGVWLDGRLLATFGRGAMLPEIRRLLTIGGRVAAVNCPGPGGILEQVVSGAVNGTHAKKAFEEGIPYGGPCSFVTSISVLSALKGTGFTLDRTCPPTGVRFPSDNGAPVLRTSFSDLVRYLSPQERCSGFFGPTGPLQGLERWVTFTAVKLDPEGSRHHR